MTKRDFLMEIDKAMNDKPYAWRRGQAVFNYIDYKYGVAMDVQFQKGIDCFHDDSKIEAFVNAAYELIVKGDVHDFPGRNMIEE